MSGVHVKHSEEANPVEMVPGITRRTLAGTSEMLVVEVELKAGAVLDNHHHPHHQAGYVISGEIVMIIDGVEYPFQSGASYAIPGHVTHGVRVIEDSLILDFFVPCREEYLD